MIPVNFFLINLPALSKFWDYMYISPQSTYVVLCTESRTLLTVGKHSVNWASSLAYWLFLFDTFVMSSTFRISILHKKFYLRTFISSLDPHNFMCAPHLSSDNFIDILNLIAMLNSVIWTHGPTCPGRRWYGEARTLLHTISFYLIEGYPYNLIF